MTCPSPIIATVSSEKVEKVVKAPRKPTINSGLNSGDNFARSRIKTKQTPIKKDPATFTLSVPKGNRCSALLSKPLTQ